LQKLKNCKNCLTDSDSKTTYHIDLLVHNHNHVIGTIFLVIERSLMLNLLNYFHRLNRQ